MIAQTVGRFTLIRKLPAGGMGRVFEADDPVTARRVALKLIDLGADADSMQIVDAERLGAELQKRLSEIDHRVTEIYEFGELQPDYFYIAMEYVEGQDLSELMRGGLPADLSARIACDVLEVLDHAHNFPTTINGRQTRGVVHGDVKPRNIRILPSGDVKVLDFGIAKALSMTRTFTQNMFGSVAYSSPERLNSGEVNVSSDLWAVAVVLYEMLAGHPYFEADNPSGLDFAIRNYRQLRAMPSNTPEALKRILYRALSPDQSFRFRSAAEFANALRGFLSGDTTSAPDDEATRRIFAPAVSEDGATRRATVSQEAEPTRRTAPPATTAAPVNSPPKSPTLKVAGKASPLRSLMRLVMLGFLILVLWGVYLGANEYRVWRDADTLARDIASERLQDLDAAWQKYQNISARSNAGASLWSAQSALRDRLMHDAERVLDQSRQPDAPAVTESDWARVRNEVQRALQLEPGDKNVRGTLRVIDGQLERIRGSAHHDAKMLEQSREDFQEAANDLKKSPDPWLGLARLYIYSLHDVEHGEAAIKEAERRGHDIGKRETSQIADGYRARAEQTMKFGDKASTNADAQRYYDLARDDISKARKMYESLVPWDGSASNLTKLDEDLMHMAQAGQQREPR